MKKIFILLLFLVFNFIPVFAENNTITYNSDKWTEEGVTKVNIPSISDEDYIYCLRVNTRCENNVCEELQVQISNDTRPYWEMENGKKSVQKLENALSSYFILHTNQTYSLTVNIPDNLYSLKNGYVVFDFSKITIQNIENFNESKFQNYAEIELFTKYSDKKIEQDAEIIKKQEEIKKWADDKITEIKNSLIGFDLTKFNKKQLQQITDIINNEISNVNVLENKYINDIEEDYENNKDVVYEYNLTELYQKLNEVPAHKTHWLILAISLITLILQFIFNKHLLIDILVIPNIFLCFKDPCFLSIIFLVTQVILCIAMTLLGWYNDTNLADLKENIRL